MTRVAAIVSGCALVAAGCGSVGRPSADAAPALRIEKLTGSVAKLGSWQGYPFYGVRLRATVCTSSKAEIYPDFTIAHYLLVGSPTRKWTLVRRVFDRRRTSSRCRRRGTAGVAVRLSSTMQSRPSARAASNSSAIHGAVTALR